MGQKYTTAVVGPKTIISIHQPLLPPIIHFSWSEILEELALVGLSMPSSLRELNPWLPCLCKDWTVEIAYVLLSLTWKHQEVSL